MIGEFGLFFLIASIFFSALQTFYPFYLKKFETVGNSQLSGFLIKNSDLIFLTTLLSFASLVYGFIVSDFSILTIQSNSNSQLPLIYKITGTWGNHEGSILLWLLIMTFFGFLFSKHKINDFNLKNNTLIIHGGLCFLIGIFVLITSNPFERILPPSIEGKDLNPLLQDPGLAIHPPMLYIGYVGFSIVYSIALSTLVNRQISKDLIAVFKPWIFLSWSFLTLGIGLGSWWAYYELGWGGFWFWDPVENASLLPWLTGTALLHSIVVSEKQNKLISWSLALAISTFCLSLLGTFLVRSGVLTSVHAFANDPSRGIFILLLLIIITGLGAILLFKNLSKIQDNKNITLVSREGAISLNNIFMLTIAGTVLLGTIYPLFTEAFFGKKISVGAPFFNSVISPLVIPMVIGMVFGPFLKWGRDDIANIFKRLRYLILLSFFLILFAFYLNQKGPVISVIFIYFGIWLAFSSLFEILIIVKNNFLIKRKLYKIPLKNISQALAHLGLALVIVGATGTSVLKKENIQFQKKNESINIGAYSVKFLGVENTRKENYKSDYATFEVYKKGRLITKLHPEKRTYNSNNQTTTEAAIMSTILGDLYIAIGDESVEEDYWTTRIWFNQYTIWIWAGVMLMFFSGILSVSRSFRLK